MTNKILGGYALTDTVNFLSELNKVTVKTKNTPSDSPVILPFSSPKQNISLIKVMAGYYVIMAICQSIALFFTHDDIHLDYEFFIFRIGYYIFLMGVFSSIMGKTFRMNHGAEHKVLNAHSHGDLENVHKYSTLSSRCGSNLFMIIILNFIIFGGSSISYITVVLSVLAYMKIQAVKNIVYKFTRPVQKLFFVSEPPKFLVDTCVEAIIKLENHKPNDEKEIHLCK